MSIRSLEFVISLTLMVVINFENTFVANLRGNVDDVSVVFKRPFALGEGNHILHHSCHLLGDED